MATNAANATCAKKATLAHLGAWLRKRQDYVGLSKHHLASMLMMWHLLQKGNSCTVSEAAQSLTGTSSTFEALRQMPETADSEDEYLTVEQIPLPQTHCEFLASTKVVVDKHEIGCHLQPLKTTPITKKPQKPRKPRKPRAKLVGTCAFVIAAKHTI